ncbi:hypothetical protein CPLU01_07869 [Colletotrichum plurivorum]|uniref:Uncharacterized protein n=1 Tax=Colletotrichum plurivorum TaxID=2175906 RepID=A0A8H6KEN4_9PEZI|nr:hypothetical protein CPLU01_07869 [Colletotrichum plurivorum]
MDSDGATAHMAAKPVPERRLCLFPETFFHRPASQHWIHRMLGTPRSLSVEPHTRHPPLQSLSNQTPAVHRIEFQGSWVPSHSFPILSRF